MISKNEYLALLEAAREIMPMLSEKLGADFDLVFEQFDSVRKMYKTIDSEFEDYRVYPRHSLEKYYDTAKELIEYLELTTIDMKWLVYPDIVMDEHNWSVYSKISPVARFYYDGIEISKLIKF